MVQIQNTDAINAIRNGARLSISEGFPQNLLPNVQPVLDMSPDFHRVINVIKEAEGAASGTITAYTTPTDADFYLTGWIMNYATDAACDLVTIAINVTVEGAARILLRRKKITTTAESIITQKEYAVPIKLDRNTAVTMTGSFTAGNCPRSITITGYLVQAPS